MNHTKQTHRQLRSDKNPDMYTNTEPKREIKDSHSMLPPKLVWELMAIRKQLPAPRKKKSITFVGITVIRQFHESESETWIHIQQDNSFSLGEKCHFGKQPAFSQRTTQTAFMFKQVCFLILWQRQIIHLRHVAVDFCDGSHRSLTSQSIGTPMTNTGIGVSPPLLTQPSGVAS